MSFFGTLVLGAVESSCSVELSMNYYSLSPRQPAYYFGTIVSMLVSPCVMQLRFSSWMKRNVLRRSCMRGCRKFCQRGRRFLCFLWGNGGSKYHYKQGQHRPARWRADDGPMLNAGLGVLLFFRVSEPLLWFFKGVRTPSPPPPLDPRMQLG